MEPIIFRLKRGDDLLEGIRAVAQKHGLTAAYVGCCVGCVTQACIRDASGVTARQINENMEIVSLTGTVSQTRCHLHVAFAKQDLSTHGGHLLEGCIVNTTAEIVLCPLPGFRFGAIFDETTGYHELEIHLACTDPPV